MQDHLQEGGARSTGDRTLDRERVTARDVSRWLGADTRDADGLDRPRRRLDVPAIPFEVRAKGRQVFERLSASGSASTDPEYIRLREYLECLAHLPWNLRTAAKVDLAQCGRSWTTACRPRRGEGTPPRSRRGTLWPGARARVRAQATARSSSMPRRCWTTRGEGSAGVLQQLRRAGVRNHVSSSTKSTG